MSLSMNKCWYSNNCLHFLKRAIPLPIFNVKPFSDLTDKHFTEIVTDQIFNWPDLQLTKIATDGKCHWSNLKLSPLVTDQTSTRLDLQLT